MARRKSPTRSKRRSKRRTKKTQTKRALCVGINDYPGTNSDLNGCVNDARDWKAELERHGYSVKLLLNSKATKEAIIKHLADLVRQTGRGQKAVFTFSGHGSWTTDLSGDEPDQRDEMLCPHDIMSGEGLLDDELAEIFALKNWGARIYFISDSCHSGSVAKFVPPWLSGREARLMPRPRFLHPLVFTKGRIAREAIHRSALRGSTAHQKYPALLASGCRDVEYSYDAYINGRFNGAFTHTALKALKKGPRTPRAWMKIIRKSLPSEQFPQSPGLFGSSYYKRTEIF
jgi:hypothetical protein